MEQSNTYAFESFVVAYFCQFWGQPKARGTKTLPPMTAMCDNDDDVQDKQKVVKK